MMPKTPRRDASPERTRLYVSVDGAEGRLVVEGPLSLLAELLAALRAGSGSVDAPFCDGRLSGALRRVGAEDDEGEGA
jgi:hypothetical protein